MPLALRAMAGGVAPVKAAAGAAAVALLRALRRPAARAELLVRLLRDFARARSCWRRAAFVDACAAALLRFSARCSSRLQPCTWSRLKFLGLRLLSHLLLIPPWAGLPALLILSSAPAACCMPL